MHAGAISSKYIFFKYFIILHFIKYIACNSASHWFPCVAPLVLGKHGNFKRSIGKKKTLRTFKYIFVVFQLPPFIHNLMEHVKEPLLKYIYVRHLPWIIWRDLALRVAFSWARFTGPFSNTEQQRALDWDNLAMTNAHSRFIFIL